MRNQYNEDGEASEAQYLSSYRIDQYQRPSVATDIVVFSMFANDVDSHRKDAELKLHVLLVRRGEHPFMNQWALPGGFVRPNETVDDCAGRELLEETNLIPSVLLPIGVFSEPGRDPRGWTISNAYVSIVKEERVSVMSGGDALYAKWFELSTKRNQDGLWHLTFTGENEQISAVLQKTETRWGQCRFELVENTGLAFDHAKIIASALAVLEKEAETYQITFDFLPERFTLAALQKVQEILTDGPLLTANFRRKISGYVEETDQQTEGVGHRPAKLYKRK